EDGRRRERLRDRRDAEERAGRDGASGRAVAETEGARPGGRAVPDHARADAGQPLLDEEFRSQRVEPWDQRVDDGIHGRMMRGCDRGLCAERDRRSRSRSFGGQIRRGGLRNLVFFPAGDWFAAFVLTLAVEVPIAVFLLRCTEPNLAPAPTIVVFANLVSHPMVWFVWTQVFLIGTPEYVIAVETWAIAI